MTTRKTAGPSAKKSTAKPASKYLCGKRILPDPIGPNLTVDELVENHLLAYNGGRLRDGARLFAERMLGDGVTVGLTLTGALTPAGLGISCVIPLIKAGFVDWIISTGANLYHDTHFGLGLPLHQGSPFIDDTKLRKEGVVRIYDILFDYHVLLDTDAFFRKLIAGPEFQKSLTTSVFHHLIGGALAAIEDASGAVDRTLLACAYRHGVPIYTSSPGDSSIGMNVAALALDGHKLSFDVSGDVNETAAIVLDARRKGKGSAIFIVGGGSPKNFALQTEPQIQEVLGIDESGHNFFLQVTDARPDTGGLSGATPAEAVSWGKVDPENLPNAVVCYTDSTIALPILTSYAVTRHKPRKLKRLYDRRGKLTDYLKSEYAKTKKRGKR